MNTDPITNLVAKGESETVEFKKSTKTRREAAQTICAMLNDKGGQILFGVTPEGKVIGQQVADKTIEDISAELAKIAPQAFPEVERVPIGEKTEVIVITVKKGYLNTVPVQRHPISTSWKFEYENGFS